MKPKHATIFALLFALSNSLWALQVERQFNVAAGGELNVRVRQADIRVRLRPGNQVTVRTDGLAESDLEISQNGNLIQVVQREGGRSGWRGAAVELVVPVRFNLNLATGAGDIHIDGNLEGSLKVNTRGGDVRFGDVQGEADVRSSGGDIAGGALAGNSQIRTLGGDIRLGDAGGSLELSTHGGDIHVEQVGGALKAKTLGGDVRVGDVKGTAELATLGGDVRVGRVSSWASLDTKGGDIVLEGAEGEVEAKTAGGDIRLGGIEGSIVAETAGGDIEATLAPRGSAGSQLNSKGGDITLYLLPGSGVTVQARIRMGRSWKSRNHEYQVISDFPATTHEKDARTGDISATYQVNGGGPVIEVETINGNIRILNRAPR